LKTIVRVLRVLLLGLWLGASVFFGAAVAPALFGILRSAGLTNADELAGLMVQRLLSVINRGGFEIAFFLLVTALFVNRSQPRIAQFAEVISLAILAIMTGVSHWIISARMIALKAAMLVPIDRISGSDPRKIAFDALHYYSVTAMGVAIIAGLIAFCLMARPRVAIKR
jgi:Domain of unknown function (DUF4149)